MSSFNCPTDVISLIERIDRRSIDMPPMTRMGYAIGVLGIAALQNSYTVNEFKDIIYHYMATLRRALVTANTNELAEKLRLRELLCGDILTAVHNLEQKAMGIDLNEGAVVETDDAVETNSEIVVGSESFVDGSNSDREFDFINGSDAEMSQADSAEWDLVSEMSN